MADIVLTGNTSGAITIAAPAVAGTNTLTLPASTGTVVTDTAPAVGGIIQVVNKVISTQGSQTIGTTDTQIGTGTDFDISITPKGAGSKFVVSARWFGEVNNAWNVVFNIQRNGARINTDGATASNKLGLSMATLTYYAADDASTPEMMHVQTVDSTGSTIGTTITYTLVASSTIGPTMWTNRTFGSLYEKGVSELMIMEVAQ
tara:strand:- start:29158 stop:29766 length:609 start_codon:yes stop_codon:yes gene_type:complete